MDKTILVTGGTGFIGSHYIRFVLKTYPFIRVINVDALTYSSNHCNLADINGDPRYLFLKVDLSKEEQVTELLQHPFDEIVHFAAESHVDRSIVGSKPFIESNIYGTYLLLEVALKKNVKRFVHISTDEVYGSIPTGNVDEKERLKPGNPYSASKASSDLLCLSYYNTYQIPVLVTRCTNNYGPNQHPEKFIPKAINRLRQNQPIQIYGNGKQERDWLHVLDHCRGVDLVRQRGEVGEIYHIGAENPVSNIEVSHLILSMMGKDDSMIKHVQDRLGHDIRYSLSTKKIQHQLGWKPTILFEQGLRETVKWYLENNEWWAMVRRDG